MKKGVWTALLMPFLIGSCVSVGTAKETKAPKKGDPKKPNVVLIYVDDMGKGMLSYYGQRYVSTPNIDKIFQRGVVFNHAYGCIYCAPARASLLTGYSDCRAQEARKFRISRAGVYKGGDYAFDNLETLDAKIRAVEEQNDAADIALQGNDYYLPQVFQKAGYTTYSVGKNDYGFLTTRKQMRAHGWDHYYGYLDHGRCHGFYPPWLFDDGQIVRIVGNEKRNCGQTGEPEHNENTRAQRWSNDGKKVYAEDCFIQKARSYIRESADSPFFLMYTTTLPHGPTQTRLKPNDNPARFGDAARYASIPDIDPEILAHTVDSTYTIGQAVPEGKLSWIEAEYAQMVKILDQSVGQLLDEVKAQGLEDNTIFIFTSDNGHEIYYSQPAPQTNRVNKGNFKYSVTPGTDKVYNSADCHDIFDGTWGFAGRKWSTWNGATNVPMAVYQPGKIEGGRSCNALISNYDLLTTFADILNVKTAKKDGVSFKKHLLDPRAAVDAKRVVTYSAQTSFEGGGHGNAGAAVRADGYVLRGGALYRLFAPEAVSNTNPGGFVDKLQVRNIAAEHPDIRKELQNRLKAAVKGE